MNVDFADEELIVDLEEQSNFTSRHTGRTLKRIRLRLIAGSLLAHRSLLLKIRRAEHEGISSTDEAGNVTGRWEVAKSSFCCQGEGHNSEYHHEIVLEEIEDLMAQSLRLNDIILCPYSYEEEFDGDELCIRSRVMVTPEQDARLRLLMKDDGYFSVVRHGICEQPREMRFPTPSSGPVMEICSNTRSYWWIRAMMKGAGPSSGSSSHRYPACSLP